MTKRFVCIVDDRVYYLEGGRLHYGCDEYPIFTGSSFGGYGSKFAGCTHE